ncbi:TrbC family F-type conjugative pilus assembly protein, partial [Turicimonas muris]
LLNPQSLQAFNFLVELGDSVELNPEIFKEFGVTKVPMLIIRKHQQKSPGSSDSCGNQDADAAQNAALVLGDVTLGYMLDTLTDRQDEIGKEAQRLRQKLGERP